MPSAPGRIWIGPEETLREPLVAEKVLTPAPLNVIENAPTPEDSAAAAGGEAPSLKVKLVVAVCEVATFPFESFAVTVTLNEFPAEALDGTPERTSWLAAPGLTVIVLVLVTVLPPIVAPRTTEPARIPVKLEE